MAEFAARPPQHGVGSLAVSGEVDIAVVETLLAEARACLNADVSGLVIDLGGVTFIDSSGLGALVRLRNEAAQTEKNIALAHVPPAVARLFEVTGLTGIFPTRAGD
ncbi:MAG: anti-sigma-factor antagonist [Marmoricola sp.]|jgi:anti-anti-sigma factor|nr:anti-sigma-factor antagonist [Marmoricola sp.]